jgi:hypothetical protein
MLKQFLASWSRHRRGPGRNTLLSHRRALCLERLEPRLNLSTFLVTDSADTTGAANDVTLPYAMTQANSLGGTNVIDFSSAVTEIDLSAALPAITNNLTIAGPGPSGLTIKRLSTAPAFGIFTNDNTTALIAGVTLTGGSQSSGGAIYNLGTLTLNSDTLENNSAQYGGAIYNNNGTLTVVNSTLSADSALEHGGAIYNSGGALAVENSTISGNTSNEYGGGIFSAGYGPGSTVTVVDSSVSDNSSAANGYGGFGGGIYSENETLTLADCNVNGNASNESGGGIESIDDTLTLVGCNINGNTANYDDGGGIENRRHVRGEERHGRRKHESRLRRRDQLG